MDIAKINDGHFKSKLLIYNPKTNKFGEISYNNDVVNKADFYFKMLISTNDNYNYHVRIYNIKNNIDYKQYHGYGSSYMDNVGFDGYENSMGGDCGSTLYIKIGNITTSIEKFYTSEMVRIVPSDRDTIHYYMNNEINFDFKTSEKINDVYIKIQANQHINDYGTTNYGNYNGYYEQTFQLTMCNSAPTISDYDRFLGEKNKAFSVDYTVWDEDNDRLYVTQKLNYDTIGDYSNVASGTSSTIYITDDMLKRLPLNQRQYIYISVDDGKGGKATRTLSFTRTNSAPAISGYDMDLGDKNVGFSIDYSVSDADNDYFNISETLNGQTLRNIPNIQGSANETITISNEQLYKTPLNQQSTLIITANDGKGGISKRTYTFTRTNTPVAIGIIKKTYPTITFRCTDSNPSGYVTRADIYINNNYIQAFTSGFDREIEYTIDFSYLNEGNNTLMIRATNNQNITSTKNLNVHKKSLKEPEIGTDIIVKGKKYQIINKKVDRESMTLVLNKPLQEDVSTTDRIEILNDYCKVFAKTDENNELEEMQFIKSKDLGNGYTQERYQLDVLGRKVTTRVNMYGNTAIKQIKEAFQYLED